LRAVSPACRKIRAGIDKSVPTTAAFHPCGLATGPAIACEVKSRGSSPIWILRTVAILLTRLSAKFLQFRFRSGPAIAQAGDGLSVWSARTGQFPMHLPEQMRQTMFGCGVVRAGDMQMPSSPALPPRPDGSQPVQKAARTFAWSFARSCRTPSRIFPRFSGGNRIFRSAAMVNDRSCQPVGLPWDGSRYCLDHVVRPVARFSRMTTMPICACVRARLRINFGWSKKSHENPALPRLRSVLLSLVPIEAALSGPSTFVFLEPSVFP